MTESDGIQTIRTELSALWKVYHNEIPALLEALSRTPSMLRLQQVGMNCGCEYTGFPWFRRLRPYSRWTHSLGVGLIVWHFTGDGKQAAAGLLHDVATPAFAHVVDFLHGDYLVQESTEDGTRQMIESDAALQKVLYAYGLKTEAVCDYHRYPIADNDAPQLSADRLEYTLGNLLNFGLGNLKDAGEIYEDLRVTENEQGRPELGFLHADTALRFAEAALRCSKIYVSDEDRFSMQMLSELLGDAIQSGILSEADLMRTEPELIEKLCREEHWKRRWEAYCAMQALETKKEPTGPEWRKIDAKRRCIDPLVIGQERVSSLFPDFGFRLQQFRTMPLEDWLRERKVEQA